MRFSWTPRLAAALCLGLVGCGSTEDVAAGSPLDAATPTSVSTPEIVPSTEATASSTSTTAADLSTGPDTRFVRLINITNADPGKLRSEGFVPDDATESHRWVTSADLDPSKRYSHIRLSGTAEPGDSGCTEFLEADGHRYQTDFYDWGTTNEIVFTQEDSFPSAFDDQRVLPFLDVVLAKRQQLEAELNLSTPATEPNDTQVQYSYVLDGDQALTLADKLTLWGRGIQSDLYLPSRSTGELHLIEADGLITEIKMSASFEGKEIVKPTDRYRKATMLEVRMAVEDLPIGELRTEAVGDHRTTRCEPQVAPASWSRD